jgi:HAD superfamily hydrolase (TIGR01549 family)
MNAPKSIRGVLFDLDGVLLDSARAWHATIVEGMQRLQPRSGLAPVTYDAFIGTFGQGVDADQQRFFPTCSVEQVSAIYEELFVKHVDKLNAMAGAFELLVELEKRGLGRAIVTNTPRDLALEITRSLGLYQRVDLLVGGGDAAEKPAPDLLLLALEKLGLEATDVVFVGDSASDRGAAKAAEVFMVGFRREGDARVDDHGQLAGLL